MSGHRLRQSANVRNVIWACAHVIIMFNIKKVLVFFEITRFKFDLGSL